VRTRTLAQALTPVILAAAAFTASGCHGENEYQSKVKIQRIEVVETDASGKPLSTDVQFFWHECPGHQEQTMRSGNEFSACMQKYKAGQEVPVKIHWEWDEHGHYDFHVIDVGGCKAPPVDDDDSSFDTLADCVPSVQHEATVGFHCDKVPERDSELVKKCPWFRVQ
jgi:hypothetical protein